MRFSVLTSSRRERVGLINATLTLLFENHHLAERHSPNGALAMDFVSCVPLQGRRAILWGDQGECGHLSGPAVFVVVLAEQVDCARLERFKRHRIGIKRPRAEREFIQTTLDIGAGEGHPYAPETKITPPSMVSGLLWNIVRGETIITFCPGGMIVPPSAPSGTSCVPSE